jgi:hypothetical protein
MIEPKSNDNSLLHKDQIRHLFKEVLEYAGLPTEGTGGAVFSEKTENGCVVFIVMRQKGS